MNPDENKKDQSIADSTLKDLNSEGVEISARISEENEFSSTPGVQNEAVLMPEEKTPTTETQPAQEALSPTPATVAAPTIAPAPVVKPIPTSIPESIPVIKPGTAQTEIQKEINKTLGIKPQVDNSKIETKVESVYKNDPSIKQLRTFKTDAEEAVRYQNVSKVNIAVAEHKKKEEANLINYETTPKRSMVGVLVSVLVLILLLGAGAGGYYWFFLKNQSPTKAIEKTFSAKTIIPYDKIGSVTVASGNNAISEISKNLSGTDTMIGQLYALIPLPVGTTTVNAPITSILSETQIPDRLVRSLGSDYMFGSYIYNQNGPFIILKNTFFQNAFAGMLEWEKNMRNDLISIIRVNYPTEQPVTVNSDIFSDTVVSNVDARVLKNADNSVVLAYAFADKDTIVIATNLDTLKFVLGRLLSVRVVQ